MYQRAIALKPDHGSAYYCYARACFHKGRMEDAARLFRRATELRPGDMHAPSMLFAIERGLGRTNEAIAAAQITLERAEQELERHPESARAMFCAAVALAMLGDRERAVRLAQRALALEPDDHPVQYNVACVYANLGEVDWALDLLERNDAGSFRPPVGLASAGSRFRCAARTSAFQGDATPVRTRYMIEPLDLQPT